MRRILAILPLAVILAVIGCNHWPAYRSDTNNPPPLFGRNKPDPTAAELVAYLNDNAKKVPGLSCQTVSIDAKQGSQTIGMTAKMACDKARNFRLKAEVMGHDVADFGSNSDEFWYWISKSEPPYVFHGKYDDMKNAPMQPPIPFSPDLVLAALGIGEYGPNPNYTVKAYKDTVELIEPTVSIQGKQVWKVTVFNRGPVSASKPQVLAYLLRDGKDGHEIAVARITSAELHRGSGVVLPKSIQLTLTQEKSNEKIEMKMAFENLQIVTYDNERRATLFALRDALENRQGYDLAHGTTDTAPGIGMGTAIQRTTGSSVTPR